MTPIRVVLADDHALVRAGIRALLNTEERWRHGSQWNPRLR